jgi:acyl carrier protein
MDDVKQTITQFIQSTYLPGTMGDHLRDDTRLMTSGILDSLAALDLLSFIQRQFGITLDVYETSADRFDNIRDIAAAIIRKRSQQG